MFVELTRVGEGARDLSWLVRKKPDRTQDFSVPFGTASVWWRTYESTESSVCLYVDVDPVQLVRGHAHSAQDGPLAQYVNDRPYAASSLLSVALIRVFRSAMGEAPEQVEDAEASYRVTLPVVPCRGGARMLDELFAPLGYTVHATRLPRDPEVPAWGEASLYTLVLERTGTLASLLRHLYVLIPVLDDDKHYWVGDDEVEKLLRMGEGWLESHPSHEVIARRYLKHRHGLVRRALEGLLEEEADADEPVPEALRERAPTLNAVRLAHVAGLLDELGVIQVADLGCGEGKLVAELLKNRRFTEIVGIDVSAVALERATRKLLRDRNPRRLERFQLRTGSATYRDRRLDGFQALVLVEVIEHMELDRLPLLEQALFVGNRPEHVIVTTPNVEHNALFENLPAGRFRHADHRFEWDRATFQAWAEGVAGRCGYRVSFQGIGTDDPTHGCPTQLARFTREDA